MALYLSRALLRSTCVFILISSPVLLSSSAHADDPLEVVVTADRSEVPLKNTGSAITVITSKDIEKFGSKNIADVLRTVPGVTIAESGGLGGEAKVQLRGASPGASMILLDGVRISDPSNTEGYFDFGNFSAANIERIEILRGPQSALYGSDAVGGVINIITKKGIRTPLREVTVEAGSYGTYSARGSVSGATDKVSYSFGVNALHSNGFPRYGYRQDPNNYLLYPYLYFGEPRPQPKNDSTDKAGLHGNISYRINNDLTIETGIAYYTNHLAIDNPYAYYAADVYDRNNTSQTSLMNGFVRSKFNAFDGGLRNQITAFGNQTDLSIRTREGCFYPYDPSNPLDPFSCTSSYTGKRLGLEYQGDMNTRSLGALTFGARSETEISATGQTPDLPDDSFIQNNAQQTTNSAFVQDRYSINDHFDVTLGGRVDAIMDGAVFPTWRSTAAYRIDQSATKLRASVGTGAKAPSLFQRFSQYGTPGLNPETSFGFDVGMDQSLLMGALNLSLTYFNNHYENKIDFKAGYYDAGYEGDSDHFHICLSECYYNVNQVRTQGIELGGDLVIVPSQWLLKASYTYIDALNVERDTQVYRVPRHSGSVSLMYTGIVNWQFEPRLVFVGNRLDVDGYGGDVTIPAYIRLDLDSRYKINDSNDAYIRFENLTDAHTEDVYNYGSAGRSVYVGWTSRW